MLFVKSSINTSSCTCPWLPCINYGFNYVLFICLTKYSDKKWAWQKGNFIHMSTCHGDMDGILNLVFCLSRARVVGFVDLHCHHSRVTFQTPQKSSSCQDHAQTDLVTVFMCRALSSLSHLTQSTIKDSWLETSSDSTTEKCRSLGETGVCLLPTTWDSIHSFKQV